MLYPHVSQVVIGVHVPCKFCKGSYLTFVDPQFRLVQCVYLYIFILPCIIKLQGMIPYLFSTMQVSDNFCVFLCKQENGKVLIHCQSGVSRSPAVAAAYLMRSGGHTAAAAMQLIKDKHPAAAPNDGFLAQLGLFQDMKCSLDLEHPVYRLFMHEQASQDDRKGGALGMESGCVNSTLMVIWRIAIPYIVS